MTRLIDANALLKKWQDMLDIKTGEKEEIAVYKIFEILIKRLNQEPTIDPVHAAAEALGMSPDRLRELAQAEKEGRLVVLEHAAKKGEKKPPCFYNDMGQEFCLGLARGECDDEPIDRCKECWYCESTREAAEAALDAMGGENNA